MSNERGRQAISKLRGTRTTFILCGLAIFFLAFTIAFTFLPTKSKLVVLGRFNNSAYDKLYVYRDASAKDASFALALHPSLNLRDLMIHPGVFLHADGRLHIWRMALDSFLQHPLGYGPAYSQILALEDGSSDIKTTHNIFLETTLSGGILSFAALLALAVLVARAILRNPGRDHLALALTGILLAVSLAFLGEDGLYLRWSWILLGLFLAEMWATARPEPQVNS